MSDCPDNPTGHELNEKEMYGETNDPMRIRRRADCIHCGTRLWVVYERSHVEECPPDERGWPLATELEDDGTLTAPTDQ